ncbi:MAG: hypothetical protein JSR34_02090 [Proteobacteria bacterium]|nr:hypothetical protein [Pseudomonadota bacterium]
MEAAVNSYRSQCIGPYYEGKGELAVYGAMIAKGTAEPFLARLAKGAPAKWQSLGDPSIVTESRLKAAVGLVGMAISHGSPAQRRVAEAYTALFIPIPQEGGCRLPEGVAAFVQNHDFWQ